MQSVNLASRLAGDNVFYKIGAGAEIGCSLLTWKEDGPWQHTHHAPRATH